MKLCNQTGPRVHRGKSHIYDSKNHTKAIHAAHEIIILLCTLAFMPWYSSKILAICKVNNDKIVVNYYKKGEKASSQLSF